MFLATDPTHGRELWVTDGIFNINLVKDINQRSVSAVSGDTDITRLWADAEG
jgi:ELWxxDGT repeat protein